jgi:hypothetical protein
MIKFKKINTKKQLQLTRQIYNLNNKTEIIS